MNTTPKTMYPLGICIGFLFAASSHAAVLVSYDFSGTDPANNRPVASSSLDPNLSTTGFDGPFTNSNGGLRPAIGNNPTVDGDTALADDLLAFGIWNQQLTGNSLQDVLDDELAWMGFTVTPASGQQLNLNGGSLSFDYWVGASQQAQDISVFSSVGSNFGGSVNASEAVQSFPGLSVGSVDPVTDTYSGVHSLSVTFTGSAFDALTAPVEFRIYFYGAEFNTSSAGRYSTIDNVVLDGTVTAIPEPSAFLLILLTVGGLTLLRRDRAPVKD